MGLTPPHSPTPPRPLRRRVGAGAASGGRVLSFGACDPKGNPLGRRLRSACRVSPAPAADAAGRVTSRTKVLPSVAVPTRPPRNWRGPFPCPKLTSLVLVVAAEPVQAFPPLVPRLGRRIGVVVGGVEQGDRARPGPLATEHRSRRARDAAGQPSPV